MTRLPRPNARRLFAPTPVVMRSVWEAAKVFWPADGPTLSILDDALIHQLRLVSDPMRLDAIRDATPSIAAPNGYQASKFQGPRGSFFESLTALAMDFWYTWSGST